MNTQIQISAPESLSFAWAKFKENWKTFSVSYIIIMLASFALTISQEFITSPYVDPASVSKELLPNTPSWVFMAIFGLTIINMALSTLFGFNMVKMILRIIDDQKVVVGDLFARVDGTFWRWVGTALVIGVFIAGVIILGGILGYLIYWAVSLFAIPIILYIIIRYFFAPYLVLDGKETSVAQALATSSQMTQGIEWQLIGFGIILVVVSMAVMLAGLIALVVGLIPAIIIISWLSPLATVHMYRSVYAQKFGLDSGEAEEKLEA